MRDALQVDEQLESSLQSPALQLHALLSAATVCRSVYTIWLALKKHTIWLALKKHNLARVKKTQFRWRCQA